MQKVLKQDLHKFVIHVNKSRPAAKDHSQSTANEGCKNLFNIFKFNNQYDMSTSAPTAMHAICINIRTKHKPIIRLIIRHEIFLKAFLVLMKLLSLSQFYAPKNKFTLLAAILK